MRRLTVLLTGILACSIVQAEELRRGAQEIGLWGGYSPGSPGFIGTARDRRLALVGIRYGFVFANSRSVAFSYVADLLPLAAVFQPDRYTVRVSPAVSREIHDGAVIGIGFAPIGFQFTFRRAMRWQPYAETTGGMLRTRVPVPVNVEEATRWNFIFDFGGGVRRISESGRAIRFGYKYHHLSNAGRSSVNPGLDSHIFYGGFSLFR